MFRWWYYRDVVFEGGLTEPDLSLSTSSQSPAVVDAEQIGGTGRRSSGGSLGAFTYMVACVAPSIVLLVVVLIDAAS
jgi:hypothetical protein